MAAQKQVPPAFLCPISLEVMKDPVTLPTGHTYERTNIEKWLRAGKKTCPVTMMPLQENVTLIPNVIVRKLIQAWRAEYRSFRSASEEENIHPENAISVPHDCVDVRDRIVFFMKEIARGHRTKLAVRGLKLIAKENTDHQACIAHTGAPLLLMSVLSVNPSDVVHEDCDACEDCLYLLALLLRNSPETKHIALEQHKLSWISWHLRYGNQTSVKLAAATVFRVLFKQDDSRESAGKAKGVFEGLASLLTQETLGSKTVNSVIKILYSACKCRENQARAVKAGMISAVVLILEKCRKVSMETTFALLELLCSNSEGKSVAFTVPNIFLVLIDKMLRVSPLTTEHAVACLSEVCSLNRIETLHAVLEAGVYPRLLLVLQSDGTPRAKCKAQELLKRLHNVFGLSDA